MHDFQEELPKMYKDFGTEGILFIQMFNKTETEHGEYAIVPWFSYQVIFCVLFCVYVRLQ